MDLQTSRQKIIDNIKKRYSLSKISPFISFKNWITRKFPKKIKLNYKRLFNIFNSFKRILTKKYFLSFLFGAILTLSFSPIYFIISAFVSISALFLLLNNSPSIKRSILIGWWFGFGHYVTSIYWISTSLLVDAKSFAWLIPFAITLIPAVSAIFIATICFLYTIITKKFANSSIKKIFLFSSLWSLFEIIKSYFPFGGFPWNLIGYIWADNIFISQSLAVIDIYFLGFLSLILFLLPIIFITKSDKHYITIKKPSKSEVILLISIIILFIVIYFLGKNRINNADIKYIPNSKIRIVQANIAQKMKWEVDEKEKAINKHINLSLKNRNNDVKGIIWSETSLPFIVNASENLLNYIKPIIPEGGFLISGGLRADFKTEEIWNSMFIINDNGSIASYYDKHHLTPFGEYFPFENILPFVKKITQGASSFAFGNGPKTISFPNFPSFSPLICYEAIFPYKITNKNAIKPNLLINITNDSWFGKSIGPYQHFDMTRMRAVENGLPMIRVANSGISAIIDQYGRVIQKIELGEAGYFDAEIPSIFDVNIWQKNIYITLSLLLLILLWSIFGKIKGLD